MQKQEKRIARLESFYQEVAEQIENMQAQLAAIREHDEEYFGDAGGGARDTSKAQYRSDDGNNQKSNRPTKHGGIS